MKRGLASVCLGLFLMAAPAAGQDAYRQTVVVTAAATPVELGTVSRSVVVITREQIAALPVASVADVLRLASSVDVRARGERGVQYPYPAGRMGRCARWRITRLGRTVRVA